MMNYIHSLKQKPEHVRHRIVLGTSAGVTVLVGIIWAAAMTSSGSFALNSSSNPTAGDGQAPSTDAFALSGTNTKSNLSELVGAVGAATGATSSPASLKIIDGDTSSSFSKPATQSGNTNPSATVIPF